MRSPPEQALASPEASPRPPEEGSQRERRASSIRETLCESHRLRLRGPSTAQSRQLLELVLNGCITITRGKNRLGFDTYRLRIPLRLDRPFEGTCQFVWRPRGECGKGGGGSLARRSQAVWVAPRRACAGTNPGRRCSSDRWRTIPGRGPTPNAGASGHGWPNWDPLGTDQRFQALVRRIGLPQSPWTTAWMRACSGMTTAVVL
jgi:hypothetical protein